MAKLTNTQRNYLHQRVQILTNQLTNALKKKLKGPTPPKIRPGHYPSIYETGVSVRAAFPSRITSRDVLLLMANPNGNSIMGNGRQVPRSRLANWYQRIRTVHNATIRRLEQIQYGDGDTVRALDAPSSAKETKLTDRISALSLKYQDIVLFDDPNPRTVLADFTRDGKRILASI